MLCTSVPAVPGCLAGRSGTGERISHSTQSFWLLAACECSLHNHTSVTHGSPTPISNAECPEGRFGAGCLLLCSCSGAPCDRATGECVCSAGWTGHDCAQGEEVTGAKALSPGLRCRAVGFLLVKFILKTSNAIRTIAMEI